MRNMFFLKMCTLFILIASCKKVSSESEATSNSVAAEKAGKQENRAAFSSHFELQEFYEIVRAAYLKKLRTFGEDGLSRTESEFMTKFSVNTRYVGQMVDLAETMFELLESGRYAKKMHGINRLTKVTRPVPKGLTDADLDQFFQIVKMEYFKRITNRPKPEMDERETNFYIKRGKTEGTQDSLDDALLLSSDLFDKIEGVK